MLRTMDFAMRSILITDVRARGWNIACWVRHYNHQRNGRTNRYTTTVVLLRARTLDLFKLFSVY